MTDDPADQMDRISALRSRAPGYVPVDPYEDIDVSTLPEWWKEAIEEYESYDLRPYQPPRFSDGELKHEVIDALSSKLDVEIRFINRDSIDSNEWTVLVDGRRIGVVGHHRDSNGYSVYEIDSETFKQWIREEESGDPTS